MDEVRGSQPAPDGGTSGVRAGRDARLSAQLLLGLVRARRFYMDDFLDGDGPYWTSVGLFIDDELGVASPLERVMELADESVETSRYLLRQMIERGVVEQYAGGDKVPAYRLTPSYHARLAQYLEQQGGLIRATCAAFR